MTQPILLMNPGRRVKRHKNAGRRKRTMSALQKAYFGGKRRRRNPESRRTRSRAAHLGALRHHRRRNPESYRVPITRQLMDSGIGAAGALGVDIIASKTTHFLPASFQTQYALYGFKGALALALGFIAERVVKKRTAVMLAEGALITVIHEAAKAGLSAAMPTLGLGEYVLTAPPPPSAPGLGWQGNAQVLEAPQPGGGMGEYLSDQGSYAELVNAASSHGIG